MTPGTTEGLVPLSGAPTIEEWRRKLSGCADEVVCDLYERADALEERFKVLAALAVAVLRDRHHQEPWPTQPPLWWPAGKEYPPSEPYWSHVVGHLIGRSWSTAYRRYRNWLAFEQIVTNDNSPADEELAIELGNAARTLIQTSIDPDAALLEAIDLKAEIGEARGDMVAARLQEKGLIAKAKWEYECPCGCRWSGKLKDLIKRAVTG